MLLLAPPCCIANEDKAFKNTVLVLEVDRQLNINDHIPFRPAFLGYCLRARTGPTASPSIPSVCHRNMRECLPNSAGIARGQRAGRLAQTSFLHPVSHPAPGEISATQEESTWLEHEREVGTSHIPSCFLLLKLHYLLQCKKYLEWGGIFNIQCQCILFSFFFFFSCLWQEADDNSISDLPIQYFVLPSNLFITTSPSMRFW